MKKKIAFVSSEITPYASTGGLAEVAAALPIALRNLGWQVLQFMPMYRQVLESGHPLRKTGLILNIPVGFHTYRAEIWQSGAEPDLYFIRRDEFFDRTYLYNLPDRDYEDNFERFVFFQKAVLAFLETLAQPVSLIHCNDWQTGLLPLYVRHGMQGEGRRSREKTVFTIHNLMFQGIFDGDSYSYSNLPFTCFTVECMEYYGNLNCMKAAITSVDAITTVSKTYAREIQTEALGCGLHGVFAENKERLHGIVNGMDPVQWDPQTDTEIAENYSVTDLQGKRTCREDLIRIAGLQPTLAGPIVGMVTRLTAQKGIDLLDQAIDEWMTLHPELSFVLLGDGGGTNSDMCQRWETRWPGRVKFFPVFDSGLARKIFAGIDLYVMPSKVEPCGLNQLYAMRYGSPPIVHCTGGLADTVIDVTTNPSQGNGFSFEAFTLESLQLAMTQAIHLYQRQGPLWQSLIQRGMNSETSWDQSARAYSDLYEQVLATP